MPCAPRENDLNIVLNLPCPDALHTNKRIFESSQLINELRK